MIKKTFSILLCGVLSVGLLAGCSSAAATASSGTSTAAASSASQSAAESKTVSAASSVSSTSSKAESAAASSSSGLKPVSKDSIKVGFVYLSDESDEGYTYNFIQGRKELQKNLGLKDDQIIEKTNVGEDATCATAIEDLVSQGCNIIFATSFAFEDYMLQVAEKYPDVQFCHATGYKSAVSDLKNVHNYFPSIYEGRYLEGIIAGMKTKTNKIGCVGAFKYAEIISGDAAFYLGAKSVNPNVTMEVKYTNTWADPTVEGETAQALIDDGCDVINQDTDSAAPATTAEKNGVWQLGYNTEMTSKAPNASICSTRCDWGVYEQEAIQHVIDGTEIPKDSSDGLANGSVVMTDYNQALMPDGAADKVEAARQAIIAGTLHVFDTSSFTVGGAPLTTVTNDFGVEFIKDGYFHEQEIGFGGSAPAFDKIIDGVSET